METETLRLEHEGTLLGILTVLDLDMFWADCSFEANEAFNSFRPSFEEAFRYLETDDVQKWEATYLKIVALGIQLFDEATQKVISDFILHIDGDKARLRY